MTTMASDAGKVVKTTQEQAVAAWVDYLNQVRMDRLVSALARQEGNLKSALESAEWAFEQASKLVHSNRGSGRGLHGYLAEVAETGIGNARSQILGGEPIYEWVNNNKAEDLRRSGVPIQMKFYATHFSLDAVRQHLKKYPDFLKDGAKYQIPSDQYEVVKRLCDMSPMEAGKLSRSGSGTDPSFKDWERVQDFFNEGSIRIDSLEPSLLEYHEVQRETIGATLDAERVTLRTTDENRRVEIYQASRPTLAEGLKATGAAGAFEGGTTFVMAVVAKRREGKALREFTNDDWADIAVDTGFGVIKGGVRGASIYTLTNCTATSAAAASAIVTAGFGIAEQANKLRRGEIGELEFIENAELVSLEAAISAMSSFAGQALIPVPVLGAVIGNAAGMVMYRTAASSLSKYEGVLVDRYLVAQHALDHELAAEYQDLLDHFDARMADYLELLERAFSPDVGIALLGSVDLAKSLGVPTEEILDSTEAIHTFFLD